MGGYYDVIHWFDEHTHTFRREDYWDMTKALGAMGRQIKRDRRRDVRILLAAYETLKKCRIRRASGDAVIRRLLWLADHLESHCNFLVEDKDEYIKDIKALASKINKFHRRLSKELKNEEQVG